MDSRSLPLTPPEIVVVPAPFPPPAVTDLALAPVLAAPGFDVVISIAVLAMGVIGWVVQLIQQNRGPAVNRRPPVRPDGAGGAGGGNRAAEEKLRNEIDDFLQDVAGRRAGQPPRRREPRKGPVDPFEEPPRRRPKPRPQPATPSADAPGADDGVPDFLKPRRTDPAPDRRPAPRPRPEPPRELPAEPAGPLRDRHLAKMKRSTVGGGGAGTKRVGGKDLGGDLRRHVERYMAVEQGDLAREHVKVRGRLDAANRELADLKRRVADPGDPATLGGGGDLTPDRLRRLLASPAGVREAIVVNELLSKPLALRPRTSRPGAVKADPAAVAAAGG